MHRPSAYRRASPNYITTCSLKYGGGDYVFLIHALKRTHYKYDAEVLIASVVRRARGSTVPNLPITD